MREGSMKNFKTILTLMVLALVLSACASGPGKTSWADNSIVTATINLLRTAYQEPTNQWFVLLSYDAYPLFNMSDFASK